MSTSGDNPPKIWVKSSYSMTNGNCVEVAELPARAVGVRDSKNPQGQVLRFAPQEWDLFTRALRRV